jgi:hypothetical protein
VIQSGQALGHNIVPGTFIGHHFTGVAAFGSGIFRVSAIDIEATGIRQYFIELTIIGGAWSFGFAFDRKTSSVQEGIFVLVIP